MGIKKTKHLIFLICVLLLACLALYLPESSTIQSKPISLVKVFGPLRGYNNLGFVELDENVTSFLKLDDYLQTRYAKEDSIVDLYIGYYYTLGKISAAHSPLVCFPGQGWEISSPAQHELEINGEFVKYEEFIATLGDHQQLVIYWYQAGLKTASTTFTNKINAFINKIFTKKQEHAFVRISQSIDGHKIEDSRQNMRDFLSTFYPKFIGFIKNKQI